MPGIKLTCLRWLLVLQPAPTPQTADIKHQALPNSLGTALVRSPAFPSPAAVRTLLQKPSPAPSNRHQIWLTPPLSCPLHHWSYCTLQPAWALWAPGSILSFSHITYKLAQQFMKQSCSSHNTGSCLQKFSPIRSVSSDRQVLILLQVTKNFSDSGAALKSFPKSDTKPEKCFCINGKNGFVPMSQIFWIVTVNFCWHTVWRSQRHNYQQVCQCDAVSQLMWPEILFRQWKARVVLVLKPGINMDAVDADTPHYQCTPM